MKTLHVAPWIAAVTLAGVAACNGAKAPEPFPQAVADSWLGAFNSNDVAGLAEMYSEDGRVLPPDQPVVTGREAIAEFWGTFNAGQTRVEVSEVTSERLGPYWFREGSYTAIVGDQGEPRIGKFIELWKKVDANWFLYRHMWSPNASQPASAPDMAVPAPDEPA